MNETALTPRRALLVARLAAERSNLLFQMRGFDEEALSCYYIHGDATCKDILAHVGYWDAFYAQRVTLLAEGRRDEIHPLTESGEGDSLETRNREVHKQFSSLTVPQTLAICLKERKHFMSVLENLSDDTLYRRIYLGHGWRASPYTWTRWRYQHDAEHAAEIAAARATYPPAKLKASPAPRGVLRALLQSTRMEFLSLAALVSPNDRETRPICDYWTLKDILNHLTVFEQFGVTALRQLQAGETPRFAQTIANFNAFNDAQVTARHSLPWSRALETYQLARRTLIALLDTTADDVLAQPFTSPWGSLITGYRLLVALAIHDQEHADVLRRAHKLPRLPRRARIFRG